MDRDTQARPSIVVTLFRRASDSVISEVLPVGINDQQSRRLALRKRLVSGLAVGGFGLVVVSLGGWWFTAAVGVIVHVLVDR